MSIVSDISDLTIESDITHIEDNYQVLVINNITLPDTVRVSTMTINCKLYKHDIIIDLLTFYNNIQNSEILPYIEYYYKPDNILLSKGISYKKKKRKSNKEVKKNFQNQTTLHLIHENKKINLKLFKNGTLQMTGIKTIEMSIHYVNIVIGYITNIHAIHPIIQDATKEMLDNLGLYDNKIRLINSDFFAGYDIKSVNLFEYLIREKKKYLLYGNSESYFTVKNNNIFLLYITSDKHTHREDIISLKELIPYLLYLQNNDTNKYKNYKLLSDNDDIYDIDIENIDNNTFTYIDIDTEYGKLLYDSIQRKNIIPYIDEVKKTKIVSYEPCTYPGVKIHYYWNKAYETNDILRDEYLGGICCCNWVKSIHPILNKKCRKRPVDDMTHCKCSGKMDGSVIGGCRKITISVFQSGNTIITGAQNMEQIYDSYNYIKEIFNNNYAILKRNTLFLGDIKLRETKVKNRKKYKIKKSAIIDSNNIETLEKYLCIKTL